jgi:hypothetical protein
MEAMQTASAVFLSAARAPQAAESGAALQKLGIWLMLNLAGALDSPTRATLLRHPIIVPQVLDLLSQPTSTPGEKRLCFLATSPGQ